MLRCKIDGRSEIVDIKEIGWYNWDFQLIVKGAQNVILLSFVAESNMLYEFIL